MDEGRGSQAQPWSSPLASIALEPALFLFLLQAFIISIKPGWKETVVIQMTVKNKQTQKLRMPTLHGETTKGSKSAHVHLLWAAFFVFLQMKLFTSLCSFHPKPCESKSCLPQSSRMPQTHWGRSRQKSTTFYSQQLFSLKSFINALTNKNKTNKK